MNTSMQCHNMCPNINDSKQCPDTCPNMNDLMQCHIFPNTFDFRGCLEYDQSNPCCNPRFHIEGYDTVPPTQQCPPMHPYPPQPCTPSPQYPGQCTAPPPAPPNISHATQQSRQRASRSKHPHKKHAPLCSVVTIFRRSTSFASSTKSSNGVVAVGRYRHSRRCHHMRKHSHRRHHTGESIGEPTGFTPMNNQYTDINGIPEVTCPDTMNTDGSVWTKLWIFNCGRNELMKIYF